MTRTVPSYLPGQNFGRVGGCFLWPAGTVDKMRETDPFEVNCASQVALGSANCGLPTEVSFTFGSFTNQQYRMWRPKEYSRGFEPSDLVQLYCDLCTCLCNAIHLDS